MVSFRSPSSSGSHVLAAGHFLPLSVDPTSHSQALSYSLSLLSAVPESLPLAALSIRALAFISYREPEQKMEGTVISLWWC